MAGIDNSIYNQLLRPPKSVAEFDQEALATQANRLALQSQQEVFADKARAIADGNKLRQVVSGFGTDVATNKQSLLSAGRLDEALKYEKANEEAAKLRADALHLGAQTGDLTQKTSTAKYDLERKKHDVAISEITSFRNPADALASLQRHIATGEMSPEEGAQIKAGIPTDPAQFRQWQMQGLQSILSAKDRMEYLAPNANTVANNQTSITTNAATNATSRANNAASNSVTMRGQNMTDARTREAASAGKVPTGYRANADGTLSFIPGGPADPNTKDGKMTEDQSKATGWLIQAENAYGNMKKVTFGKDGKLSSAAKPGLGDAIAEIPFAGGIGNRLRSDDRQKFVQGASSLSESLLRAATGAGVNISEAKQKIEELTPVFGDSDAVIKQKFDAIPLYIDSLKVRSGAGAKKAAAVLAPKAQSNDVFSAADAILKGSK